MKSAKDPEGPPIAFARVLCDYHAMPPNSSIFPIVLKKRGLEGSTRQIDAFAGEGRWSANLSPAARAYMATIGLLDPDRDENTAGLVWMHALAIGYAPAYLSGNADGIGQDWPRIPLPDSAERLKESAALGRRVAALLDTEALVEGVTSGRIRPEIRDVAQPVKADGGNLDENANDLEVTAGWGHAAKEGVCMPGKGNVVVRDDGSIDVYWNERACWRNVPTRVWEYTIGGYQILKKWLSYREKGFLGRALTPLEVEEFQHIARRIAALVAIESELDDNYRAVTASTYQWTTPATAGRIAPKADHGCSEPPGEATLDPT